ncbi:hypothetical protein P171DRAFT_418623 [Karstenula rhodostoma CBS 690.94]|uniref:PNPLA domain-containing protein n=1 Tax=Karstenula rhodostoma CBS 690.94 TaxID=1392251 RepID=A0A9P4PD98_9PLEO|nr:hypothetical protein P171DRAFT_418623 [Karstenula rhodostoma CBS 690.94]
MSHTARRKAQDGQFSSRPPPYTGRPPPEIPVSRSSKTDGLEKSGQHRSSFSRASERYTAKSFSNAEPANRNEPPAEVTHTKTCGFCDEQKSPIWNCSYCDTSFCDPCWDLQLPHRPGKKGPDGLPHEKANPTIVKRLKDILTPSQDHYEQHALHMEDEDTTWFGLDRDSQNRPVFQDYGRYSAIMVESNNGDYRSRYPQLVSFIGQTGAGKSTLIKMLIDQQERKSVTRDWGFPSPVAGSLANGGSVPTSGDVHLYSDPKTHASGYPMLYADCEGLEGGENTPMAAQYRSSVPVPHKEKKRDEHIPREHRKRNKITKPLHCTQRDIKWANSPETLKRQYAVTELYPRLLYTFSDVIVFVLRNPKVFESTVISLLINWASTSLEKSLNQPTLPHAIIVLNATDTKVNQGEWDPEYATSLLMSSVSGAIERDPDFRALKEHWSEQGKHIQTMKDLLECYYSSITVVRIPGEGRYMMIDDQIEKLHDEISRRCSESLNAKRRSRMLSNSETLNTYLQCAFDHFAQDLHQPFDFMDVSFKINPIPSDFGGNILKLAVAMKSRYDDPRTMFKDLSYIVASCILLDCARQNSQGLAEQILDKHYLPHCDYALEDYCAIFCPCTYRNKRGEQCVNVKERHSKGHQNKRGHIIGTGPYEAYFTFDNFMEDWAHHLRASLTDFQNTLSSKRMMSPSVDEVQIVSKIHHANLNKFYSRLGGAQCFVSHTTCFCCLRELAEHALPCGHVLCTPCIKGYGKPHSDLSGSFTVASCPLHEFDTIFPEAWDVHFKPPLAGVRVLSLDGGGMRGIVILEVLRQLQTELRGMPVQDFFDLIVGTSTGGILALGLGIKNWSISTCITLFTRMVDRAFTPRFLGGVSFGKPTYRASPLEESLKECFGEESIFGGGRETSIACTRKVAVTAATETGERAVIFTNYNRADDEEGNSNPPARATSAAPTFFKPFRNPDTKEGYVDGAIFHNNPVRIANYESKLLWPDVEDRHPDILLSLGTAHHGSDRDQSLQATSSDRRRMHIRRVFSSVGEKRSTPALRAFGEMESWVTIFKKRIESVLDAELTWKEFRKEIRGKSSEIAVERYIRINPRTKDRTPKMDDKDKIRILHDEIKTGLTRNDMQIKIKTIAYRLVASSFYFEKSGPCREAGGHVTISGMIRCRFAAGSENLRNLGDYMRKHQRGERFQPFFRVQEVNHDESVHSIPITAQAIRDMIERGRFDLGKLAIPVTSEMSIVSIDLHLTDDKARYFVRSGFPISGFPRSLSDGDVLKRIPSDTASMPERPRMASKRQSLREKRHNNSRISLDRPSSDSNISYELQGSSKNSNSSRSNLSFPDTPDDVSSWSQRRMEASRPPPKPVQQMTSGGHYHMGLPGQPLNEELYELDSEPVARFEEMGHSDENDEALVQVLERSRYEAQSLQRTDTGTDEEELAKALSLSMQFQ